MCAADHTLLLIAASAVSARTHGPYPRLMVAVRNMSSGRQLAAHGGQRDRRADLRLRQRVRDVRQPGFRVCPEQLRHTHHCGHGGGSRALLHQAVAQHSVEVLWVGLKQLRLAVIFCAFAARELPCIQTNLCFCKARLTGRKACNVQLVGRLWCPSNCTHVACAFARDVGHYNSMLVGPAAYSGTKRHMPHGCVCSHGCLCVISTPKHNMVLQRHSISRFCPCVWRQLDTVMR